jgi:beta-glucosidase-like glycosyl hydrolase
MAAHVVYPALDAERPATLSRAILGTLLRERLGYRGVAVSDDLAMHALDGSGPLAAVAVASFNAGCDLVLACQSLEDGETAVEALGAAARRGEIESGRLRSAEARLRRLRTSLRRRRPAAEPLRELLRSGAGVATLQRLEERLARRAARSPDVAKAAAALL